METQENKKPFFDRGFFPFVLTIVFSTIFIGLYLYYKESALQTADIAGNANIANIFETYGIYVGVVL